MSVTIYHNPKCSKSRQTLKLLEENGITPTIIEYLKIPPTAETLKVSLSGYLPSEVLLTREKRTQGVRVVLLKDPERNGGK